jgi:hypothetical protein
MLSDVQTPIRASRTLTGHAARHRFFPAKNICRSWGPRKRASYRYFYNRVVCFLAAVAAGRTGREQVIRGGMQLSSCLWPTTACQSHAKKIPKMGGGQQARNDGTRATQTV